MKYLEVNVAFKGYVKVNSEQRVERYTIQGI